MYITVENAIKTIKHKRVLDGVNATFEKGKVYGLVGPNGSGKTMLLRALCGFIRLDSGRVTVNDQPVEFGHDLPEKFGVIIENPGFSMNQSGLSNLQYLASLDKGWDGEETYRLLGILGLAGHEDEKVKSYSLGMRQKLAIVQALMEHQNIILLDEPTNGLDKESVAAFLKEIKRLSKEEGKTIIIASHHDNEIKEVTDVIYTVENGTVRTE
ncbi:ABC transporter [Alloscardovia macacae]|uniref:ABC transporter n=1 Tax=Alloscardovia macacae TaxID=1160091 RepID=A0A1Y2T0A6_9BIFI|nr:ATP-binding cassette domain-containing protein [Alloscardovia macacae]OTA26789.1 ABC transporter [Alloscardovia macacae]OTA29186.1 ABC transporter [Alloscardovia macacae]